MSFLPDNMPAPGGNYLKFAIGDTRFRPTAPAIAGRVYWQTIDDQRRPVRVRPGEPIAASDLQLDADGVPEKVKNFICFPVLHEGAVKILEVTQATVMQGIEAVCRNPDWGDPTGTDGYDITVTRTGSGMDTSYTVTPCPKKAWGKDEVALVESSPVNLDALYDNGDPFEAAVDGEVAVTIEAPPAKVDDGKLKQVISKVHKLHSEKVGNTRVFHIDTSIMPFITEDAELAKQVKNFGKQELVFTYLEAGKANILEAVHVDKAAVEEDDIPF